MVARAKSQKPCPMRALRGQNPYLGRQLPAPIFPVGLRQALFHLPALPVPVPEAPMHEYGNPAFQDDVGAAPGRRRARALANLRPRERQMSRAARSGLVSLDFMAFMILDRVAASKMSMPAIVPCSASGIQRIGHDRPQRPCPPVAGPSGAEKFRGWICCTFCPAMRRKSYATDATN
jgi:hypothetical protein